MVEAPCTGEKDTAEDTLSKSNSCVNSPQVWRVHLQLFCDSKWLGQRWNACSWDNPAEGDGLKNKRIYRIKQ